MKPYKQKDSGQLFSYGIRLLGLREWSRHGMRQKMKAYSHIKSDIEDTLDKLEEYGYLDDNRFTEIYVRSCKEYRGYGPVKIKFKLKEKGISDALISIHVIADDSVWHIKAHEARQRRFGEIPSMIEERLKQSSFLMRRGFSYDQIRSSLKDIQEIQD